MSFQIHTLGFFLVYPALIAGQIVYMGNKILVALFAAIILLLPQNTYAQEKASRSSANIINPEFGGGGIDYRVKILENYLNHYNSPLKDNAKDFVYFADRYNLDWRLVAAISGVESTYGKQIPPYSYNGWGWGVYGDNVIRFASWKEGIATVSQGLREKYINKWGGENIYEIGSMYASSPHWANSVNTHLAMMDRFMLSNPRESLPLSL